LEKKINILKYGQIALILREIYTKNHFMQPAKIAGFTFIRNALLYDYPIVEAIQSILPICDYFVVAVGKSDDQTLDLIKKLQNSNTQNTKTPKSQNTKIHILETEWDDFLKSGGQVLAQETQKAFNAIPTDFDWCFYIQGDECVHENDLENIKTQLNTYKNDSKTEGFVFKYKHFFGSYDYVALSRNWYRQEVRIVRNDKNIHSYKDAQGFRWSDNQKLKVRALEAYIYHYGWVKPPEKQQKKQQNFNLLWHSKEKVEKMFGDDSAYKYEGTQLLSRFEGTHPKVIAPRIQALNWQFTYDAKLIKTSLKDRISLFLERKTGWLPWEYKNYRVTK
jgi:hypothetical protein